MAKIQARNIDEGLFERITQSAMKNERSVEGEIRLALATLYPATDPSQNIVPLSMRDRWQQETGQRLRWMLQRLNEDGFGERTGTGTVDMGDFVRLSGQLGTGPGLLMDIAEGRAEMTAAVAGAIEKYCGVRTEWLITGEGDVFPVQDISGLYEDFFLPADGSNGYIFELLRVGQGFHEGATLCLRRSASTGQTIVAVLTGTFHLSPRNGSGGRRSLLQFLTFLKEKGAGLAINTFDWAPEDEESEPRQVAGMHHLRYFQQTIRRTSAGWLQLLLNGKDPEGWFAGHTGDLEALAAMPYGGAEPQNRVSSDDRPAAQTRALTGEDE
ncbi:hypothetical protein [Cedecea sp.]|uniref:hypothetical protein n=1 Tax=Cedecea sp. TaxID=1970739 RepID=UPI002F3FA19A